MSNLKNRILNKQWVSHGNGWTFGTNIKVGVVPRYGVVFTCVDADPIIRPKFENRSHWKDNRGNFHKLSYGPIDLKIPCVKFEVKEPASLPRGFPPKDTADIYDPPRDKLEGDFLNSFKEASFMVVDNCLVAPMVKIKYQGVEYHATMIVTFNEDDDMLLRSYWSDGYEGGYCCP